ncbi:class I SAM-dependent methyltransferase [Parabacteroides sp. 52]|uniref:class I SAM-dependent methyltransferase n=1 Tax=unclassified Parabacteroides TaxID=2649774 RepID=UPI0013D723C8|nr:MULTISPECIES: class I SAM-dependent methyltransferase [unclassified Parabacteroides]MDH6534559.1 2-polyprenyl-3-methyl-5-hydroxy-6-metoxy-1,4-benzoquinol methylase [Parabacteroides sp. PM5-20]NDV55206.1 class I SAM-dependent methyltransferase [Parabacteroides sp. 52]
MVEFWESSFRDKQAMWGLEAADSAYIALELFRKNGVKKILIPGFGYGRNAKPFLDNGIEVTGIEISETAIELAEKHFGETAKVYHGSVTDMPFDDELYDAIFCYALIHLLNVRERRKLIADCFQQLNPGGYMVFSTISKEDALYGKGKRLSKDRFERIKGAKLFFYDEDSIKQEFHNCGLIDIQEIDEPVKQMESRPPMKFTVIICKKPV